MKPSDIARERQLDADLKAALGHEMPGNLADRITTQLRQPAPTNTKPATGWTPWLAAAGLLLGIVVVASVAGSHGATDNGGFAHQQKPDGTQGKSAAANVSMQDLKIKTVTAAHPADAIDRLLDFASLGAINIVITASVTGESKVALRGITAHEAIERIATELGASVAEFDGVMLIGALGQSGRTGKRVTMNCKGTPVHAFLKQLHAQSGVNLVAASNIVGQVRCQVKDAPWRVVLDEVCRQLGLEAVGCGTVLAVRVKQPKAKAPQTILSMRSQDVRQTLKVWSRLNGRAVVLAPNVSGKVTVSTKLATTNGFLRSLAAATSSTVTRKHGVIMFQDSTEPLSSTTLTTEGFALASLEEMAGIDPNKPAAVANAKAPAVHVLVSGANGRDVVRAARTAWLQPWPQPLAKPKTQLKTPDMRPK